MDKAYGDLQYYDETIAEFKEAIRLEPDYAEAHFDLDQTYLIRGDKSAALEEYRILKGVDEELAQKLLNEINK